MTPGPGRPRRRAGLCSAVLDGEAVVYDPGDGSLHHLDRAATQVWLRCDGGHTLEEMVAAISAEHGAPPAEVRAGVAAVLGRLAGLGLVSGAPSASGPAPAGR
ncbi:MAG: hypothetical protein KatS3mg009_1127 [Acidimicrobiia bacterium]|nr:MAG: hypothetical protein KatS3mg009_1127 [Acidimicrobiia bacterium]